MKDIVCPNCHTTFQVDESTYNTILNQVRNKEFNENVNSRLDELRRQLKVEEESNKIKAEKQFLDAINQKEKEIADLKTNLAKLQGIIESYDAKKNSELSTLKAEKLREIFEAVKDKESRITELEKQISQKDSELQLKVLQTKSDGASAIQKKEQEIIQLKAQIENARLNADKRESELKENHHLLMRLKDEEIERLKNFKLSLSTKMLGETLEQHCANLFSQAQSMGQYPNAKFGKDNLTVEGTKGDFIFRDFIDEDEYVSIMFEMKNEADATATKHRNDEFLDKLHQDREKKNCEYAVLVSMLEQGNEVYDMGIVDKSHVHPKMIVIRPQFFLPVLRLITEGARKGYMENKGLAMELEKARNENLDFSKFQKHIDDFKDKFNKNIEVAHKKFTYAQEGLDKAIKGLEAQIEILKKIKANFTASEERLIKASTLTEDSLTVKKLTHGAPTIRKMIEEAED